MAIKLIAFDLDGTLLNSRKEISDENLDALQEAGQKGILLIPASGRLYPGLPDQLKSPLFRYSILCNGMTVFDQLLNRRMFEYTIPLSETLSFFDYAEQRGIFYDIYADDLAWMTASVYENLPNLISDQSFLKMLQSLRHPVNDLRTFLLYRDRPIQKILFYFTDLSERKKQLEQMPLLFPDYNITSSIYCNIEINNKSADKGLALLALCDELKIDPSDTMVLGDSSNDLGLFRTAGFSVAMANADDSVKIIADAITGSCEESGVAQAIRKYAL